jgi:hypothetical protein
MAPMTRGCGAACATAYPNLGADFTATVNRLDTTPVVAQARDESGSPKMIADMGQGDSGAVAAAYLALRGPPGCIGLGGVGLALTVFCAEHANLTLTFTTG